MGQFQTVSLDITKDQLAQIHHRLAELCITKESPLLIETESASEEESPIITTEDESPIKGVISKIERLKHDFTVKEEMNYEQIIRNQDELLEVSEDSPTEQIVPSPPQTKLGQRRNNSIFRDILGRKAD